MERPDADQVMQFLPDGTRLLADNSNRIANAYAPVVGDDAVGHLADILAACGDAPPALLWLCQEGAEWYWYMNTEDDGEDGVADGEAGGEVEAVHEAEPEAEPEHEIEEGPVANEQNEAGNEHEGIPHVFAFNEVFNIDAQAQAEAQAPAQDVIWWPAQVQDQDQENEADEHEGLPHVFVFNIDAQAQAQAHVIQWPAQVEEQEQEQELLQMDAAEDEFDVDLIHNE